MAVTLKTETQHLEPVLIAPPVRGRPPFFILQYRYAIGVFCCCPVGSQNTDPTTCVLEEEVGEQEAQKTKQRDDLNGDTINVLSHSRSGFLRGGQLLTPRFDALPEASSLLKGDNSGLCLLQLRLDLLVRELNGVGHGGGSGRDGGLVVIGACVVLGLRIGGTSVRRRRRAGAGSGIFSGRREGTRHIRSVVLL